jgi:hypothetical protein
VRPIASGSQSLALGRASRGAAAQNRARLALGRQRTNKRAAKGCHDRALCVATQGGVLEWRAQDRRLRIPDYGVKLQAARPVGRFETGEEKESVAMAAATSIASDLLVAGGQPLSMKLGIFASDGPFPVGLSLLRTVSSDSRFAQVRMLAPLRYGRLPVVVL